MPEPWTATRQVTADDVRRLVARHAPAHADTPVTWLASGWDNSVWRVGPLIARVAARPEADAGVRRELALLPRLAPVLPLRVPDPIAGGTDPVLGAPWLLYEALPGAELADRLAQGAPLTEADRLARFLHALHAPERATRLARHLPHDPLGRGDPNLLIPRARTLVDAARADGLELPWAAMARTFDAALRTPPIAAPVLVHGDLHLRHVLTDPTGAPVSVIDWGDACLCQPAVDLALMWGTLAPGARAPFLAAYGRPVDAGSLALSRAFSVYSAVALLRYAHAENLGPLRAASHAALARTLVGEADLRVHAPRATA